MKVTELVADDDAVSPVIGVILMVAITVILAAVIGTFVLGIGQDQQTTPSASFDFDYNSSNDELNVTHAGGDTFNQENTNSLTVNSTGGTDKAFSLPVSAGDSLGLSTVSGGETVRVIWTAPGGGKTNTVGSFDTP